MGSIRVSGAPGSDPGLFYVSNDDGTAIRVPRPDHYGSSNERRWGQVGVSRFDLGPWGESDVDSKKAAPHLSMEHRFRVLQHHA